MKKINMHLLKNYVLYLLLGTALLTACSGKDGEPGPKGDAGVQGPQGVKGPGRESLVKRGNITGKVTGMWADGTPLDENFSYEFSYNSNQAAITEMPGGKYQSSFIRYDSLQHSYLSLLFETEANFSAPRLFFANFGWYKAIPNNEYKRIEASLYLNSGNYSYSPSPVTSSISNVQFNVATGMLTGSFSWKVDNASNYTSDTIYRNTSDSGRPLQITGTFSIPTKQRNYRVGIHK